ncbi:MAG: hypothetical protein SFX18_14855 [Pirellulales bacterium]|nr:hypothetical protein [Pirellulales bacterium]
MATRRTVRRIRPLQHTDFDEQLWPINIALLVLTGFLGGLIYGHSSFDWETTPWYQNGWVRLATLFGSMAILLGVAIWLKGKIGRRMQLGAIISLFLHALLGWQLYNTILSNPQRQVDRALAVVQPNIVEYNFTPKSWDEPDQQQDFEKPVEIRPEQQVTEPIERQVPQPKPVEQPNPIVQPDDRPQPLTPVAVKSPQPEVAAPKRNQNPSKLSRSTVNNPAATAETAANPTSQPRATAPTPQLQPQTTTVTRQTNAPTPTATLTANPSENTSQPVATTTPRAETTESATAASKTPQLTRAVNQPAAVPTAETATTAPLAKSVPTEKPLAAAPTTVAKASPSPALNQPNPATDVAQNNVTSPAPTPARVVPTPNSSAVATKEPANPRLNRSTSNTADASAIATQAESATTATAGTTATASTGLQAPAAQPQRATGASAPLANTLTANTASGSQSNSPAPSVSSSRAPAEAASAGSNSVAASNTTAALQGLASQAQARNTSASATESVTLPSISSNSGPASNQLGGPSSTSLTRSNNGLPGTATSNNFEQSWADAAASNQPAAAASQAAATQVDNSAPAASSPSRTALARNSVTGGETSAATVQAQDVANPTEAGAASPTNLQATASAANSRTSANVPTATVTASAGQSSADTGQPQVTSTGGAAQGAGGNQPRAELASDRAANLSKAIGGGATATQAELAAADLPAAGTPGGGQPSADNSLQANASGGARGDNSANLPSAAQLAATGDESSAGSPGLSGATAASTGSGSVPAAQPGAATAPQLARTSSGGVGSTDVTATDVGVPGLPQENGVDTGTPIEALAGGSGKTSAGLPGPSLNQPLGAAAGDTNSNTPAGTADAGLAAGAATANSTGTSSGPSSSSQAGALARATSAGTAGIETSMADLPNLPTGTASGAPNSGQELQPGLTAGSTGINRGSVQVELASLPGSGGIGDEQAPQVGSLLPQARMESTVVSNTPTRFLNRTSSGITAIDGQIREAAPAFKKRGRISSLEPEIISGLTFLAKCQDGNGSWSFQYFPGATRRDIGIENLKSSTAATGLSLLAFLGAGYDHYGNGEHETNEYKETIAGGLRFLVEYQQPNGDLYIKEDAKSSEYAHFYSHGIATIALCEAYGMTGDAKLKEPAQKALDFIVASQDKQHGGWRYAPGYQSDTSVTGWQIMALKSGELAGLKVDPAVYVGVRRYLESAQSRTGLNVDPSRYVYNPNAANNAREGHGRLVSPTRTSMGLLMRMYLGWNKENPNLARGAQYLLQNPPELGTQAQPKRDTYYWYYATQVMFHMQGDYWREWNKRLRPLLVNSQVKTGILAGSWDPGGTIPDEWGNRCGGRIYVTAMNLLSLEVSHRYLPIYENIAEPNQVAK